MPRAKKAESKCILCKRTNIEELSFGGLLSTNNVYAHHFCLLLSETISQSGEDRQGIWGFLKKDILKEVTTSKKKLCYICNESGASLGCKQKFCRRKFHLPCALMNKVQHDMVNFTSYCHLHRKPNNIPKKLKSKIMDNKCLICLDNYTTRNIDFNTLVWSDCCKKDVILHLKCVQQLAFSAGYFTKCPACNNKETFINTVKRYGVFVPERDASWELTENAFTDLLQRHSRCDVPTCVCPKGREFKYVAGNWKIILCSLCGSFGGHKGCVDGKDDFVCNTCNISNDPSQKNDAAAQQESIRNNIEEQKSSSSASDQQSTSKRNSIASDQQSTSKRNTIASDQQSTSKKNSIASEQQSTSSKNSITAEQQSSSRITRSAAESQSTSSKSMPSTPFNKDNTVVIRPNSDSESEVDVVCISSDSEDRFSETEPETPVSGRVTPRYPGKFGNRKRKLSNPSATVPQVAKKKTVYTQNRNHRYIQQVAKKSTTSNHIYTKLWHKNAEDACYDDGSSDNDSNLKFSGLTNIKKEVVDVKSPNLSTSTSTVSNNINHDSEQSKNIQSIKSIINSTMEKTSCFQFFCSGPLILQYSQEKDAVEVNNCNEVEIVNVSESARKTPTTVSETIVIDDSDDDENTNIKITNVCSIAELATSGKRFSPRSKVSTAGIFENRIRSTTKDILKSSRSQQNFNFVKRTTKIVKIDFKSVDSIENEASGRFIFDD